MKHVSAYTDITAPRWGKEEKEYTLVKKHPPFVYGTSRNACLIHKIREVRLRWWTTSSDGHHLVRLQTPRMTAETNCSMWFQLNSGNGATCAMPNPDAVLCAKCHGLGVNFPKGRQHLVSRAIAKINKSCIGSEA
jgi:hypothetical protein